MNEIILEGIRWRSTGIRSYYVSETGCVANIKFENEDIKKMKILKLDVGRNGYRRAPLKYEVGKERKYLVHRLVYQAFVGELQEGMVIDHIDSNRSNNHYTNLRQVTQKENISHALHNGGFGGNHKCRIAVYDKELDTTTSYSSISDFLKHLGIGQYDSINALNKYSKYKNRFEIVREGSSTTESVDSEKDTIE